MTALLEGLFALAVVVVMLMTCSVLTGLVWLVLFGLPRLVGG